MNIHCIGNIAYWHGVVSNTDHKHYVHHTFQKQSELSQYEILTANGRLKLSVPTQKSTRKGPYSDVLIDYNTNWQTEHWRSIENAYLKSPFFLYYGYKIETIYKTHYDTLLQFNKALFATVADCLKLKTTFLTDHTTPSMYVPTPPRVCTAYPQVFDDRVAFQQNLSVLDLIFNLGPEASDYLVSL